MPGEQEHPQGAPQEQVVRDTLDLFCNSAEQTYEDLLMSFTRLPTGVARGRLTVGSRLRPSCKRGGARAEPGRDGEAQQTEHQEELDMYFAPENFAHKAEDATSTSGPGALPGEVEEAPPTLSPSFHHYTQLEFHTMVPAQRPPCRGSTSESQAETEEVLPFSLDENFDYDHVILSHKHPLEGRCPWPDSF
ncbi:hypothetical protein Z043_108652 [Scleropages formosus]|uniref:Intraflagellar transport associated protein n=1 Tax=Scleropages formosus TaxID=113540 RepID=A0A0N8K0K1_SCLFO|nr:hypothetical protein Z043_108652 [Scleropages formosus]